MAPSEEFTNNMTLQMRGGAEANAPDWKPTGHIKPLTAEDAKCPEITLDKSEEAAMTIQIMNSFAFQLDEEYLAEAARQTRQQASSYDAMAALNQMWMREQSMLLDEQANALEYLAKYIKSNKRIAELRAELEKAKKHISKFNEFG